jgi:succinate dehydrogenase / fumarate reductase, cytochrome b subunit
VFHLVLMLTAPAQGFTKWLPVKDNRPKNLDLLTVRFPLPAITSILHRISGVFIFAGVAVLLWLLAQSLSSEEGFRNVQQLLDMALVKLVLWAILSGLLYHLIAGIKHLIMDLGIGESLEAGRSNARLVIIVSAIAIVAAGVWIW